MNHRSGRWPAFLALLALTAATQAADPPDKTPVPEENKAMDAKVSSTLRDVINRGADLYNAGDYAACYRLYEGSLITLRPLIDHRPELQKAITAGIASAERDPLVWRRAFTLRNVIDKIRADANPKKVVKKLPVPDEDKEPGAKKPVEKVPVKKKPVEKDPDDDLPPPKKPVQKKSEDKKKADDKKGDDDLPPPKPIEKKPEDKKPIEKKADDKKVDDILPPPKTIEKKADDKKPEDRKSGEKKDD
jgi:hypothetical protein